MTLDELKSSVTMSEVLSQRGFPVVRGMASCPFHGADRHPSMKVYKDGFKCFTCGQHGDIVDFVRLLDGVSFKDAFTSLGGTYQDKAFSTRSRVIQQQKWERQKKERIRKEQEEKDLKHALAESIRIVNLVIQMDEPFSEDWCAAQDYYPKLIGLWETKYIEEKEINRPNVFGMYRDIRRRFIDL